MKGLNRAIINNLLHRDLFDPAIGIDRARELFRTYVQVVEIENHSYCNRTCWFCQNSYIDRRSKTILMETALFEKILSDLASIDYDQVLLWSRYHEVLADDSVLDRMRRARDVLPKAYLKVFSNGDYMDHDLIGRLEHAGLDRMYISHYLADGKENDPEELDRTLKAFVKRTGTTLTPLDGGDGFRVEGPRFYCTLHPKNFTRTYVSDRAGSLQVGKSAQYVRTATCLHPLRAVVIDYNGKGMLCCETRSDVAAHSGAIIGDLNSPDYSLFHFYRDMAPIRENLVRPGVKDGVCRGCDAAVIGSQASSRRSALAWALGLVPGLQPLFEKVQRRHLSKRPI